MSGKLSPKERELLDRCVRLNNRAEEAEGALASSQAEIERLTTRVELLERTLGSATAQLEFLGVEPDGPTLRGYYQVLIPAALSGSKE